MVKYVLMVRRLRGRRKIIVRLGWRPVIFFVTLSVLSAVLVIRMEGWW